MIPGIVAGAAVAGGGGGGGDPYFANVEALLHFEGSDGSTTVTDVTGRPWTAYGVQIDTDFSRAGAASLILGGTGTRAEPSSSSADFTVGTGDFTIELSIRASSLAKSVSCIFDQRPLGTQGLYPTIYVTSNGTIYYYTDTANKIASASGVITENTWYDIALSRVSGTTRLFVNGSQVGSDYADTNNYVGDELVVGHLGFDRSNTFGLTGNLDEFRFTKGVGRYSGSYTPSFPFLDS